MTTVRAAFAAIWAIAIIRWTLIALITVALWMGIAKLATGSAHEASRAAVTLASGGAESVGTLFGEPIPHAIQHWHKVAGTKWCHYPKISWDKSCKLDPNATPNDSSRPQDDGSDDPNFCPSFTEYDTYYLPGEGACKLETLGPVTTLVVPEGWKADYWTTASTEAKAVAGEEITTSTATFRKVK